MLTIMKDDIGISIVKIQAIMERDYQRHQYARMDLICD